MASRDALGCYKYQGEIIPLRLSDQRTKVEETPTQIWVFPLDAHEQTVIKAV